MQRNELIAVELLLRTSQLLSNPGTADSRITVQLALLCSLAAAY
jgi:hypothetical protein